MPAICIIFSVRERRRKEAKGDTYSTQQLDCKHPAHAEDAFIIPVQLVVVVVDGIIDEICIKIARKLG
jgi:hypothetical protein